MDAHQGRERAVGIVGQQVDVIDFGEGGDLAAFGKTAAVAQVRLDVVGRLFFQQLAKGPAGVEALAGGDGDVDGGGDAGHFVDVFGRHRLFEEEGVELFQQAGHADGHIGAEAAVALDEDFYILADGGAGGADARHGQAHIGDVQALHGMAEGIAFEPPKAQIHGGAGRVGEFSRRLVLEEGVGVELDALAQAATHQLVDRGIQVFSFDVPQGLLDAAEGAGPDGTAAPETALVECLPEFLDAAWVAAHQLQLSDGVGHGGGMAIGGHFAQAGEAGIGVHQDEVAEHAVARPVDGNGLDLGYFHVVLRWLQIKNNLIHSRSTRLFRLLDLERAAKVF